LKDAADGLRGKCRHKIQVFRETVSAITPPERRTALENQRTAVPLHVKLMQKNQLGDFGPTNVWVMIGLHRSNIRLSYDTLLYFNVDVITSAIE
jgi:hypothetical protein